jgi:TRAP-type uncharacterized transport system substrate-binding protein
MEKHDSRADLRPVCSHRMKRLIAALIPLREFTLAAGPFVLIGLGLLALATWKLDPTPPRQMTLATGAKGSAYELFGKRYKELMHREGIQVMLVPGTGSSDNLTKLQAGQVDAGFVQFGRDEDTLLPAEDTPASPLLSLGNLFQEQIWIFYREPETRPGASRGKAAPREIDRLAQIIDWRIAIDRPDSSSHQVMKRLFASSGYAKPTALLELTPDRSIPMLLYPTPQEQVDAVVLVAPPEDSYVQMLLRTPGVKLFDFGQAEAYEHRLAQISPVTLHRGVVDPNLDLPPRDLHLLAVNSSLVVRDGTHPALQQLLTLAARQIHGATNWFHHRGEYPQARSGEFPLSDEAARIYQGNRSLPGWLPFWARYLLDRMWLAVLSIAALLIPLARVVPPLYTFRVRSRVFRWYGNLLEIETQLNKNRRKPAELLTELDEIERNISEVLVPLSYADELYTLRSHVGALKDRVRERIAATSG